MQIPRIEEVVFDGIARPRDVGVLETANTLDGRQLDIEGQAGRDAVRIELVGVQALGLHEHLVLRAIGEAHHLVFDGRAVPRPDGLDHAGVHRRAVESAADDVVRGRIGMRDVADGLLRMHVRRGQERHHRSRLVSGLRVHNTEIHAAPVEARRRPGLQPVDAQRQGPQALGQGIGRCIARASAGAVLEADVDATAEKRAGRQHDAVGFETQPHLGVDTANPVVDHMQVDHRLLEHRQVRLRLDDRAHRVPIQDAVCLRTGGAYRRTLSRIQRAEVDTRPVRCDGHGAAQGIDLAHQVGLADAADGRVARHLPDGLDAHRQQQRPRAHASGRQRGLGAGMTAADDDDVETFRMIHGTSLVGPVANGARIIRSPPLLVDPRPEPATDRGRRPGDPRPSTPPPVPVPDPAAPVPSAATPRPVRVCRESRRQA